MNLLFENIQFFESDGNKIKSGKLYLRDGKIAPPDEADTQVKRIDGKGRLLTPGLIDVHTHGVKKYVYETSPQDLIEGLKCLPEFGTTSVCPTFYTVMSKENLPRLENLAKALDNELAVNVPGFHLEGPFLKLPGAGASTLDGDVKFLDELLSAAKYKVAAMSISPDVKNIVPVIERLVENNIKVFMTHTRADYEQTHAAIGAGARHATHFYDVFQLPGEATSGVRPVGAVEAILEDRKTSVDFICDGVHVHPGAIRMAVNCKGYQSVILITDSNIGAGLAPGKYETPWGFPIYADPKKGALNADPNHPMYNTLAGSALTMDMGINNLLEWLDIPEAQTWQMATKNPATMLGLKNKGKLENGCDGDLVLWDFCGGKYKPAQTWVNGDLKMNTP